MNELIPVNYENETPTVSGRDLHEFLGIKDHYTDWFRRMTEYGFAENVDFASLSEKSEKPATAHARGFVKCYRLPLYRV